MQFALGVTAINKEERLPHKRKMWITPSPLIPKMPQPPPPVHGNQGKPSLRRIKGRIHRSKSLDSVDLMDSNEGTFSCDASVPQTVRSVTESPSPFSIWIFSCQGEVEFRSGARERERE
ncbi:hypothetical protein SKAU_G00308380 [Synaphobranchus kaupii]|uniref:Uncharacterized protein n=1 Tax=Synaphobranchus kaupii TaxID=118154 RepID=A0A9Q1IIW6_SYNKA|nr:hypothetical protein SKAU_G00308380 [Synaphobranchus kaupii]